MGRHSKKKDRKLAYAAVATTGAIPLVVVGTAGSAQAVTYTAAQVAQVAKENCPQLSAAQINTAVKIAYAESGFNTDINAAGAEDSRGLWQINRGVHGDQWGDLYSPANNARAMCSLSNGGSNWRPWSAYTNGSYLNSPGYLGAVITPTGTPHVIYPGMDDRGPSDVKAPAVGKTAGTYTVKQGDTLYNIATTYHVGSGANRWMPLYNANRRLIGADPDLIYPGQVLKIPGRSVANPVQPTPASNPSTASYVRPVPGYVSQPFHNPGSYGLGYHTGADFHAAYGTPVHAVAAGTVVGGSAGAAYGNYVIIQHGPGVYTLSAHLSAKSVSPGQHVSAGQVIGNVGSTGNSNGAHLHFELRSNPTAYSAGVFSDPVAWLRSHGVSI